MESSNLEKKDYSKVIEAFKRVKESLPDMKDLFFNEDIQVPATIMDTPND